MSVAVCECLKTAVAERAQIVVQFAQTIRLHGYNRYKFSAEAIDNLLAASTSYRHMLHLANHIATHWGALT